MGATNSITPFVMGILTVLVIISGVYFYMDFVRSKTTVANYSAKTTGKGEAYIYDKNNKDIEKAIDKSITENLDKSYVPVGKSEISGTLCYPSSFLPKGEVVAKNTDTNQLTTVEFSGLEPNYTIQVEPGTYNLRYQAHASGDDKYTSGYYTKCGIDSNVDVCDAPDGHKLIPVPVSAGELVSDVKLCDFYYQTEPKF
jgi:hypothetical protein